MIASKIVTDSRESTEFVSNPETNVTCRIKVRPGAMTLKLEKNGSVKEFRTRHGDTLAQVRAFASEVVQKDSLYEARKFFNRA